jgi:hypothetical protein
MAIAMTVFAPAAVIAAGGHFTDDETSIFEDDINWMADSAVTLGCNPPTDDRYCPDDNVTRGQMAAFMHRLAENQVVDAATAIEADHATSADSATQADSATMADTAGDAGQLEGFDGTSYAFGTVEYDHDDGSTSLTSTEAVVAHVTVTIPDRCDGLLIEAADVLVIGSGYFNGDGTGASALAFLSMDGTTEDQTRLVGDLESADSRTPYMTQWVFSATPGDHTFELVNASPAGTALGWWPRISAQVLGSSCSTIILPPGPPPVISGDPDGQ